MPSLVVPFRGVKGKSRLQPALGEARAVLARAMLADVVEACAAVGPTFVVGPAGLEIAGAALVPDPGGGQGAAVRAGLAAAALASGGVGPYVVVNADLPCVTPRDLLALAGAVPGVGLALAPATDGTTNALALSSPELFVPLYGPGSAARFSALAGARTVDAPNLVDDIDTLEDLERVRDRLGPHTRDALGTRPLGAAA
jgi:2-phospho-L-lactate/phosphoenolpyruvate guanylyltransferase